MVLQVIKESDGTRYQELGFFTLCHIDNVFARRNTTRRRDHLPLKSNNGNSITRSTASTWRLGPVCKHFVPFASW